MNKNTFDVKVLSGFTDKHTDKKYKKGDVIKGITETRFNEILSKGKLVEKISQPIKEDKKQ